LELLVAWLENLGKPKPRGQGAAALGCRAQSASRRSSVGHTAVKKYFTKWSKAFATKVCASFGMQALGEGNAAGSPAQMVRRRQIRLVALNEASAPSDMNRHEYRPI
jgi:hypothetical protein